MSSTTDGNERRMRGYAKLAVVCFYIFLAVSFAADDQSRYIARLGIGSAATLWWVADSCLCRRALPYASLWNGLIAYPLLVPTHYLTTRGAKGLRKLLLHAGFALAVVIVAQLAR